MSQAAPAPDVQTLDQLQSLEQRILHVIQLLEEARAARQAAEQEAARLRSELADRNSELVARDGELAALRPLAAQFEKEREEIRRRVEKLLRQFDSLTA
jgi:chromosome segregation ATPase